jgi:hypothetical protein
MDSWILKCVTLPFNRPEPSRFGAIEWLGTQQDIEKLAWIFCIRKRNHARGDCWGIKSLNPSYLYDSLGIKNQQQF